MRVAGTGYTIFTRWRIISAIGHASSRCRRHADKMLSRMLIIKMTASRDDARATLMRMHDKCRHAKAAHISILLNRDYYSMPGSFSGRAAAFIEMPESVRAAT